MRRAMKEKLAQDLNFMKASAVEPLRSFIDMIQHAYQLENVIFVIEGLKGGRTIEQMMKTVDPIGYFRELEQMTPIDSDDYASMYQNVLVDLPIGVYFKKFLDEMVDQTVVPADSGNEVDAKFI
jgi:V-type H+-transporting ATPase subunit d